MLPLLLGFAPGAPMGWRAGAPVSVEQFLHAAAALARRLPQAGHCINVCEDRLNFMVGFAASLIAGSVSLLPQSRAPAVLRAVAAAYPGACRLADFSDPWELGEHIEIGPWPDRREPTATPVVPADQVAVVLFTSGTTGTPSPHAKSWGSLAAGAHALRSRVPEISGASIVSTVPPQHMWGLETTVILPLQSGCAVHAGCPLLPADIAAGLERVAGPRWLVATPAHLRGCALSGERLSALAGVLCSTAALPEETARRVEELGGAPVIEIYGSTETGAIATRRTSQTPVFLPVEGIELRIAEGQAEARGGHLAGPVRLNDMLLDVGRGHFSVVGRTADVVKIGGSRNSLAALTAELNRVPGVVDGVYWLPDSDATEPRLMAFAVAPGIERAEIIAQLRRRVDPVFLPRPLVMVDALPRNSAGKLTRESLASLAALERDWQTVDGSHPALAGHFPGDPVVPGAWLLALVERAARERYGDSVRVLAMPAASFRSPLRPQEPFRILLEQLAPDRVAFRIEGKAELVADGTLVLEGAS